MILAWMSSIFLKLSHRMGVCVCTDLDCGEERPHLSLFPVSYFLLQMPPNAAIDTPGGNMLTIKSQRLRALKGKRGCYCEEADYPLYRSWYLLQLNRLERVPSREKENCKGEFYSCRFSNQRAVSMIPFLLLSALV